MKITYASGPLYVCNIGRVYHCVYRENDDEYNTLKQRIASSLRQSITSREPIIIL